MAAPRHPVLEATHAYWWHMPPSGTHPWTLADDDSLLAGTPPWLEMATLRWSHTAAACLLALLCSTLKAAGEIPVEGV